MRASAHPIPEGEKSFLVTLLLSYFLGMFGADRFYLGKTGSAKWKLLTLGGLGYWWIFDLVITLFGGQRDNWGLRLEGFDRHKKTVWKVLGAIVGGALVLNILMLIGFVSYDGNGLTAVGWSIVGGVALVTAGVVGSKFLKSRGTRKLEAAVLEDAPVPPTIQTYLNKLSSLRQAYVPYAAVGDEAAAVVIMRLDSLVNNAGELFRRLQGKASKSERGIAQTEYEDKLGRIAAAVDHDYLLDLLANPRLWEDPHKRIKGVQVALAAVDDQLLENIRQVNALKGLVFEVSIDGLLDPFMTEGR